MPYNGPVASPWPSQSGAVLAAPSARAIVPRTALRAGTPTGGVAGAGTDMVSAVATISRTRYDMCNVSA